MRNGEKYVKIMVRSINPSKLQSPCYSLRPMAKDLKLYLFCRIPMGIPKHRRELSSGKQTQEPAFSGS
jgi:hypothetical protein